MINQLKIFFIKTLENMASVKFLILILVSGFFCLGMLDATTWQQTVLAVAGLRAVNEVAGMMTNKRKYRGDDPDA